MNTPSLEQKVEALQQKVERLEYYIDLLRDFATDPETFVLWDWVMSRRLTQPQVETLMHTLKSFSFSIKAQKRSGEALPDFEQFCQEIIPLIHTTDYRAETDDVIQLLKRVKQMGILKHLQHFLPSDEDDNLYQ